MIPQFDPPLSAPCTLPYPPLHPSQEFYQQAMVKTSSRGSALGTWKVGEGDAGPFTRP